MLIFCASPRNYYFVLVFLLPLLPAHSLPGSYREFRGSNATSCKKVGAGYFSPGGPNARRIKCPPNTTTDPDSSIVSKSVSSCLCNKGYEPVRERWLTRAESTARKLQDLVKTNEDWRDATTAQLCKPCGRSSYKNALGPSRCTRCPPHSFSTILTPTSITDCNRCQPGYFRTSNISLPCARCDENYYCPGSISGHPVEKHSDQKVPCPNHSTTLPPYDKNEAFFSCT